MNTFEVELRQIQDERQRQQWWEGKRFVQTGEGIYARFCAWCNVYYEGKGKDNPKLFASYLEESKTTLTWWQRKCIAEKYFGYDISWDGEKWIEKKGS